MSDFHPGSVRPSLSPNTLVIDIHRIDLPQVESRMERCHDVSVVVLTINTSLMALLQSYPDFF